MSIDTIDNFMEIAQETSKEGKLPHDIERLLKQRYYKPGENWGKLVDRVVTHVCQDDESFTETARYYLENRIWLPNSPCLFNSGTKSGGLFACFVVGPDKDTLEHHVDVLKDISVVGKRGGGCGFTGTFIREKGATVAGSAHGYAYGPNAWALKVSDYLAMITQSGQREMALMYTMRSDHPDLDEFISLKQTDDERFAYNFNQSIMATDSWMQNAIDNKNGEHSQLKRIAENSWENGDPGLLFYTTINENTPYSTCSCTIEATNPCQPGFATILTPNGIRAFDDIDVGSTVWSGNQWTTVTRKVFTGIKPVYRYRSSFGEFIGTKEHEVFQKGKRVKVKHAEKIDAVCGRLNNDNFAPSDLDPIDIMDGLVIGDGSVHKASNNLVFLLIGENDNDYFKSEVSPLLVKDRSDGFSTSDTAHAYEIKTTIDYKELPHTYERSIPERFVQGSAKKIAGFLRGLFSANASAVAEGRRISLKQSSIDLILDVQKMLSALGIRSYITINKATEVEFDNGVYPIKESYDLNITQDRYKFLERIGFIQEYKCDRIDGGTVDRQNSGIIQEVEFLGNFMVYDIAVDAPEHSYWTGGLLVSNCGEQPLPSYGSCNLGSINLAHEEFFNEDGSYDYAALSRAAKALVRFLDNVGEQNVFPNQKFEDWYSDHRPIGIGVMGFADACLRQELTYGKQDSLSFLGAALGVISSSAIRESERLGKERGIPEHCGRVGRRNITVMSIAPTGSIGFIAGCSHGIEPIFSPKYQRTDERGETYIFEHPMKDEPYFVSSIGEKTPTWQEHIDVQAMTQAFVDSAVSKTVNMPHDATIDDVYNAMVYAWKKNCKGITIYRDGSRQFQVLEDVKEGDQEILNCPDGICEI